MEQADSTYLFQKPDLTSNGGAHAPQQTASALHLPIPNQHSPSKMMVDDLNGGSYQSSPSSPRSPNGFSSGDEKKRVSNGNGKPAVQPIQPVQQQPSGNGNYISSPPQPIQQQHLFNPSSSSTGSTAPVIKKEHRRDSSGRSSSSDSKDSSREKRKESSSTTSSTSSTTKSIGSPNSSSPMLVSNQSSNGGGGNLQIQHQIESLQAQVDTLKSQNQSLYEKIRNYEAQIEKKSMILSKYRKTLLQFFEDDHRSDDNSDRSRSRSRSRSPSYSRSRSRTPSSSRSRSVSPNKLIRFDQSQYQQHQTQHQQSNYTPSSDKNDHKRKFDDISIPQQSSSSNSSRNDNRISSSSNQQSNQSSADKDGKEVVQKRRRVGSRKHNLWTPEDDEKFTAAYNKYGKSWKAIHGHLPDKTREQVQSHGQYLIRIGKLADLHKDGRRTRHLKDDNGELLVNQNLNSSNAQPNQLSTDLSLQNNDDDDYDGSSSPHSPDSPMENNI